TCRSPRAAGSSAASWMVTAAGTDPAGMSAMGLGVGSGVRRWRPGFRPTGLPVSTAELVSVNKFDAPAVIAYRHHLVVAAGHGSPNDLGLSPQAIPPRRQASDQGTTRNHMRINWHGLVPPRSRHRQAPAQRPETLQTIRTAWCAV